MLTVLIWLLTAVLLIDCLLLVLLVLVQLPKKEAGAGMAFGGAATDALFGAGSGTALTKITKYAATVFFVGALSLAVLHARDKKTATSDIQEALKQQSGTTTNQTAPQVLPQAPTTSTAPAAPQSAPANVPPAAPTVPATTNQ